MAISAAKFGVQVSDYNLLTVEDVEAVLPRLHVAERLEGVTAQELYTNQKIPFGFDYLSKNIDYNCDATSGDHGCHVAGHCRCEHLYSLHRADGDVYYAPQENGVTGVAAMPRFW